MHLNYRKNIMVLCECVKDIRGRYAPELYDGSFSYANKGIITYASLFVFAGRIIIGVSGDVK